MSDLDLSLSIKQLKANIEADPIPSFEVHRDALDDDLILYTAVGGYGEPYFTIHTFPAHEYLVELLLQCNPKRVEALLEQIIENEKHHMEHHEREQN